MWLATWDSYFYHNQLREKAEDQLATLTANSPLAVYPPEELRYSAFSYCGPKDIKVVIIGQDPYHGPGQANGLSFSVAPGCKIPPSLRNIYKELVASGAISEQPDNGDLSCWAQQGVLLLNTVLSVFAGAAHSHAKVGWEEFTKELITKLGNDGISRCYLLWGAHAHKFEQLIDERENLILKAVHPSPLSASRGFFGCNHFNLANQYLEQSGQSPVDWRVPSQQHDLF